jgi:hypothetical protein
MGDDSPKLARRFAAPVLVKVETRPDERTTDADQSPKVVAVD